MAYYVKNADIFGRIGTGLGKGLAEQVPKEMENSRLRTGLKALADQADRGDLSPAQFLAQASGTYGITPQMVQSFGDLAKQQNYLKAVSNQYGGNQDQSGGRGYIPTQEELSQPRHGEIPTLADEKSTQESYKNYIPPTEQEERNLAYKNFVGNEARYDRKFENALADQKAITQRNQERQLAFQNQEKIALDKEEKIEAALDNEAKRLGLKGDNNDTIPPLVYQKFQDQALKAVLPKDKGGRGLTQRQAIKEESQNLNTLYDQYKNLGSMHTSSPRDFQRRLDSLRPDFVKRGEEKQLKNQLVSDYLVSPMYASHRVHPLNQEEKKELNKIGSNEGISSVAGIKTPAINYESLKKAMGKTGSPLSIAYELEQKGRDPRPWLKYLAKDKDHLEVWQAEELDQNVNVVNLMDTWLRLWE